MRATIVIEASDKTAAHADLAKVIPGIVSTFDVGLVTVGSTGPIAAYWASLACTPTQWAALAAKFDGFGTRRMFDGDSMNPDAVLAACGLARLATWPT